MLRQRVKRPSRRPWRPGWEWRLYARNSGGSQYRPAGRPAGPHSITLTGVTIRLTAADDHVDGPHLGDADFHGRVGGPFRRCCFGGRSREGAGVDDVERAYVGEPRDRHGRAACRPAMLARGPLLSGVGDSLDDPGGPPRGQLHRLRGRSECSRGRRVRRRSRVAAGPTSACGSPAWPDQFPRSPAALPTPP
jgi:hypothetical protein